MSTLLSTTAMVAECQRRVPIGLTNAFWMRKLNEALRGISQKGAFIWDQKSSGVVVNSNQYHFPVPADCDPGRPMYLDGPTSTVVPATLYNTRKLIPMVTWDSSLDQQYAEVTVPSGMYSCWTPVRDFFAIPAGTYSYNGLLYPVSAAPTVPMGGYTFHFVYHVDVSSVEYAEGASVYFPTPNIFDGLFIDLAEAEAKRIYGLSGWEIIQKKAEASIMPLLDSYRSQKNAPTGLLDQQKQTNENKLMAQERA